jgi:hypothetical protein
MVKIEYYYTFIFNLTIFKVNYFDFNYDCIILI